MGNVGRRLLKAGVLWLAMTAGVVAWAQTVPTTTVEGTVYLADGSVGAGTLLLNWPAFTTAGNQAVAAGNLTVTIGTGGSVSVNLAANAGSNPAGLYYTAVFHLSDGTVSTQYWVVPAATTATLASVQAQLMPAAQAVQTASKAYVDAAIAAAVGSGGGTVGIANGGTGASTAVGALANLGGANLNATESAFAGEVTGKQVGGLYQVDQFAGSDFAAKLAACMSGLSSAFGGICDGRNFSGTVSMSTTVTISTANTTVFLPCATISTAHPIVIPAGVRNVTLHGCGLRGASAASGSQGGTVLLYSGTGGAVEVGDPTYAGDTQGFHLDNVLINLTGSSSAATMGLTAYRTQELDLESIYFLGNSNQTGLLLDGTGNYTGGSFYDLAFNGFQTAVSGIGHQISNPATTDWLNASTFLRVHIDCPTSGGSPISGTVGINLAQGDGNSISGGDVEGCATALHLGSNAQNNTIVGLRNENSTNQVVADSGSAYNAWITGGTMFTGALTDNGTRNSFLDTFHRAFNGLNGDWYGSQKDATVTNHFRIGIGAGNERGMLDRYQTDFGYRWTMGLSDATAGEQFYQILDELNSVYRFSVGQYNSGSSNTNNQTVINAAGTGAVVVNGSNNAGTGGLVLGSGGATETTVATVDGSGNADFTGTLQVGGVTTHVGSVTVKNQADAEIDSTLWAGWTTAQKESFIYKDWNGNSQWYMVKDTGNNWALNSAIDNTDHFKAYQNGETMLNSNGTGYVSVNREANSGTGGLVVFSGGATPSQVAKIDGSGNLTVASCTGCGGSSGMVNSGTAGQLAYYAGSGTAVSGETASGDWTIASGGVATLATVNSNTGSFGSSTAIPNLTVNAKGLITAAGTNAVVAPAGTLTGSALAAGVTGSSLTGVGTIASGVWQGTAIANAYLANSAITVAGQTCTLGGSCALAASNLTNGLSGSGAVALVSAPTFTGNTTTWANGTANSDYLVIQPGTGTTDQIGALEFASYAGTSQWEIRKDASNYFRIRDAVNGADRVIEYPAGETILNAGTGANVVGINNTSGSGTGGLIVYGGGTSNYGTAELTVTGSGNVTANGFLAGKFAMGEGTMSLAAGAAAGSSPTIACATSHVCDGVSGTVTLTTGTSPTTGTLATLSFPNTHTNQANCVVSVQLAGTGLISSVGWSESTTALTLTANAALTASTAYAVKYWCGGN